MGRTVKHLLHVALLLALLAGGCASNTATVTELDKEGRPIKTTVTDQSDASAHNQARLLARLKALEVMLARPTGRIIIPKGATLKAEGGDITFEVNVPPPQYLVEWAQYREPWLEGLQMAGGYIFGGVLGYAFGWGPNFQPATRSGGGSYVVNNHGDGTMTNMGGGTSGSGWRFYPTINKQAGSFNSYPLAGQ